jgi:hypothetical protein
MTDKINSIFTVGKLHYKLIFKRQQYEARNRYLTNVILLTQETDIRKIKVQDQPRQNESKTLSQKYTT